MIMVKSALRSDIAAMIDDKEIWACAHQVIKQYGDVAWLHAAQRADDLFEENDQDGYKTWLRILNRIKELEQLTPQGTLQ